MTNVAVFNIGTKPIKNRFEFNFNSLFKLCIVPLSLDLKSMLKTLKKYWIFIATMGGLSVLILTAFYNILKTERVLPIYQPAQVNPELVDSSIQYQKKYHKIADFELINQNGARITQKDSWVSEYRDLLKESFDPRHKWFVGEHRGSIRLEVKDNGKKQTILLPYDWSNKGFSAAIPEIQQIYKRFYEGNRQLSAACEKVKVSSSNQEIDLTRVIFKDFRKECPNASDTTWNKSYVPVLSKGQELLERSKGKPQNSKELMGLCLNEWEYGSRARQIARRALQKFLNFAVSNEKLSMQYAPIKIEEKLKSKRVGYALTDSQILQLIASEKDPKWQLNFQLLAGH